MPGMPAPPVVLSIAGYDPSSGAGVTADVQTIRAHGCYPITCVTALTVQTTMGVTRFQAVDAGIVGETLQELLKDFSIAAVRIGMLGSGQVARTVADFLASARIGHVVLDPIVKSSSGADLIDKAGQKVIRERLLPVAEVITPNLDEVGALIGSRVHSAAEIHAAPRKLHAMGARAVVITGGHRDEAIDLLSLDGRVEEFWAERIQSTSTHGTGCAFATSIACELAKGKLVREAVLAAKRFVRQAIEKAEGLGKGTGPMKLI